MNPPQLLDDDCIGQIIRHSIFGTAFSFSLVSRHWAQCWCTCVYELPLYHLVTAVWRKQLWRFRGLRRLSLHCVPLTDYRPLSMSEASVYESVCQVLPSLGQLERLAIVPYKASYLPAQIWANIARLSSLRSLKIDAPPLDGKVDLTTIE